MERRDFIKKTGLAAIGAFAAPYILPTGRLFASTGAAPLANHVILVMFAGGVRKQESIGQTYLQGSQMLYAPTQAQAELNVTGNIMRNMLEGAAPTSKIVYGKGAGGQTPIAPLLSQTLQQQGMLFTEMKSSSAGHYGGLNVLVQGNTFVSQGLKQRPVNPTIFEYLRRHGGPVDFPASKLWFVGNGIGNSLPLLNHSDHPQYGTKYGANFFAPTITFGPKGDSYLRDARIYHPQDQLAPIYEMKYFLDNSFENVGKTLPSIGNTEAEKDQIKHFMKTMFDKTTAGTIAFPPEHASAGNGDTATVGYACEVLKEFKPKLTVVNLSAVDTCHSAFTDYLKALHRADHAVGHLWNFVQNDPVMAGNTTIIAVPDCGRDATPNYIKDSQNDFFGYDHSDANALDVFCLMAGPGMPVNTTVNSANNPGFSSQWATADIVPTIADILGLKADVMGANMLAAGAGSLFDKI
ncbi:MAG: hypothetical protein V4608_10200 [Bacteroidota bacterium]